MPASALERGVMPSELEVCVGMPAAERDPLAAGGCQPADSGSSSGKAAETTGKKRALDAMQSDGHAVEVAGKTEEDTPDRTSSEDEQQQQRENPFAGRVDAGKPPMVPVKVAAKAPLLSEGVAAANPATVQAMQLPGKGHNGKATTAKAVEAVVEGARRRDAARSPVTTKKLEPERVNAKLRKVRAPKKVAAKPGRVDRRRKRKESKSGGISQASAKMLFQCSCQLLRKQALDDDMRAREMEERNGKQVKEIEEWEKRIRSLKRELEEYADEQSGARPGETAGMALVETGVVAARASGEQTNPLPAAAMLGAVGAVEPSLAPAVVATEAKLQEELLKRTLKVNEFCRSVPGFIDSLDEQAPRQF
ncbi:hypothetical protein PHYPSEUDO_007675 [Phytophthora pseudosyringae]|uniref:Uncharacterized protein n=1 Tax=Phytophthora pseudosyringae TaxID=221518 RepID=A0A8T1VJ52_9STRA|nr:hypothetical protein PHYPSEUDO_007675 [Phytophthora pseudosyringae]